MHKKLTLSIFFILVMAFFVVSIGNAKSFTPSDSKMTDICNYDQLIFEFNQKVDAANKKLAEEPKANMKKELNFPKRVKSKNGEKSTLSKDAWDLFTEGFRNHND